MGFKRDLEFEWCPLPSSGGGPPNPRGRGAEAPTPPPQPGWSPADIAIIAALELAAHDHQADAPAAGMWAVRWLEGRPAREARSVANRFRLALAYYVGGRVDDARRLLEGLAAGRAAG